jgi:thiol-disulfide isomerase/thioredoxin/Flp pilus assembly protein TadD
MKSMTVASTVTILSAVGLLGACSGLGEPPDVSAEVEAAKEAFVTFELHRARDMFAEALSKDPEHAEAAYGHARTLMVLNLYDEALAAFERALELSPDDPRVHEGYVATLLWGGKMRGRRAWLDRAIEAGAELVRAFPDRTEVYDLLEQAAGELNQPETSVQVLEALEPEVGDSPVFRVGLAGARLAQARSMGDEARVGAIEDALREDIAAALAAEAEDTEAGAPGDAGRRFLLAMGHKLLEDAEEERRWLVRLDETAEGRIMGALWVHFDLYFHEIIEAWEGPPEEKLEIIERWKARFEPTWEVDTEIYLVPLELEWQLLMDRARTQHEDGAQPSGESLDRIVAISEVVVRGYTWGSAERYRRVATTLVDLGTRLEDALRFASEGIEALEGRRAGLLYPGLRDEELEEGRESWTAALEVVRGQALAGLERRGEAEQAFERAIELSPRSDRFAAMGELLAAEGRFDEAYEAWISEVALAAAGDLGRTAEMMDRDFESRRAEVIEEARFRLVTDRIDREAPDFELTDTEGNEWRLSELRGSVVLLNFWATWCGPCRTELPHYQELVDGYAEAGDVVFLAINTDFDQSVARDFLEENGYRFTVLFDEGISTDYQVTGIPTHFILGPEGRIQYITGGIGSPQRYMEGMRARIEALRPG